MSKYLIGAAAAAFMMVGGSAAWAQCPEGSTDLPNSNWSWQLVEIPGSTNTTTDVGDLSFSGKSGNANAEVTTTTVTISAGHQCLAINPGQQVDENRSLAPVGGEETIEETVEVVKVCQNAGNQSSTALVDGVDCTNPAW